MEVGFASIFEDLFQQSIAKICKNYFCNISPQGWLVSLIKALYAVLIM